MSKYRTRYIGPRSFYLGTVKMAIPSGLQQLISSCMGIVDSLMISWIGQVTAVGTAVQVETLCTEVAWACAAGIGIFSVQFFGAKNQADLKKSFGLGIAMGLFSGVLWLVLVSLFGREILGFYIKDREVIANSWLYLRIARFSYIPLALSFVFNTIYRSVNKPHISLVIGIIAVAVNVAANYICIFGFWRVPAMGIQGAALGTCIAQTSSLIINVVYAVKTKQPFIGTMKEMFSFSVSFTAPVLKKTVPVIFNEIFFGFGSTLFVKAFGNLGTDSMDAYYVGAKLADMFYAFSVGFSNAMGVILGISLGVGKVEEAKKQGDYFISMAAVMSAFCAGFIFLGAGGLVSLFNLSDGQVVLEAIGIVRVFALRIALRFFIVVVFSALRAGGDSRMLIALDSCIMWGIGIPLAFISVHWFHIQSIALVFLICQAEQVIRLFFGLKRYRKGSWAVNLTALVEK